MESNTFKWLEKEISHKTIFAAKNPLKWVLMVEPLISNVLIEYKQW